MKRFLSVLLMTVMLCPVCRAEPPDPVPGISAVSAILVEAGSGRVLYEKNAHERRSIASITKLMTALVAVEAIPDLNTVFRVKPEHMARGSSMYLKAGEELTLEQLLYGLLLSSGNDAALTIAEGCGGDISTFVEWMNHRAHGLGMEGTHFANPNGLDQEGHYSTAADMAQAARAVLQHDKLANIISTRSVTIGDRHLVNHNKLLWRYEGCRGMKTGYTDQAGRTLVSCAERNGMTLICVTLDDPNDWVDHKALLDYGFKTWHRYTLARAGKEVKRIRVQGGLLPQAPVRTAVNVAYPLQEGERVRVLITLPDQITAPVMEGEIAGGFTFMLEDQVIGETYLVFSRDIPQNPPPRLSLFQNMITFNLRGRGASSLAAFLTAIQTR